MSKPTKIILDKQSDLILTNAQIVGATGIVKSDLPGLVTDLANLDTAIQTEATDRSTAIQAEAAARAAEIAEQRLRIDAILDGADVNLNQFREVVAFVQSIDLANDTDLLAKVAEINGKISAEETARIAGDAKLTADLATLQSYVDTTVNSAITQLTSDLADLQSYVDTTVDSAITSLTADLSVETAARIADVDAEEARALAAEAALQAAIDAEAAARIAADETLDGKIADIISNTNAPIIDSFTEVVDNLNAEIASRIEGDSQLAQQISDEAAARIAGDENLQSEIDALTQAVNVNITDTINNEAAARIAGDQTLQSEIDLLPLTDGDTIEVDLVNNYVRLKEVVAAPDSGVRTFEGDIKVGEQPDTKGSYNDLSLITKGILDNKVSQEVSNINSSISEEVARAQNAESQLQSNIDTQTGRIDAILEAAGSETDNFAEIVALINSVDTTNDEAFASYVISNNERLSVEEQERLRLTNLLGDGLVNEQIAREDGDAFLQHEFDVLPTTDGESIEVNPVDNTIRLKEVVEAPASGYRVLKGDIKTDVQPDTKESFNELSFVTKGWVDSKVNVDLTSALQAEEDARTQSDAALQANIESSIAEEVINRNDAIHQGDSILQAEIDLLPLTDGDTIEVDLVNNYVRLKEVVAAPDSGVRTFEGDIKVGEQPDTKGSYNDLSLITKGIMDSRLQQEVGTINSSISDETTRAQNAESQLQSNIDTQTGRIDAILEAAGSETDNFAEIVALINSVDTTNDEAFASYVLSNNERLSIEEQERLRLTNLLGDGLVNEQIAREDGDAFLQHELDILPMTDGETIEVNPVDNTIRLKDVIDAPDAGYRTFRGDVKAQAQPETNESFNELSFVTKGWVDSKVNVDLTSAIETEESERIAADTALQGLIDDEAARAMAAEAALQSDLSTETERALAAEDDLQNSLNNEIEARIADVNIEEARAMAAEANLQAAIDAEAAARIAADETLDGKIADIISNSNAPIIDSFTEVVDTLNAEIARAEAAEAAEAEARVAAISAEEEARIAGDAQLSSDLADLQSYVDTTVNSAIETLTSDLSAETAARIADVDAEETRALAAEGVLQTNINTEANERVAEDITLQGNIDIEATRAQAAETTIAADLGTETAARIAAVSAEEARATAAEFELTSDLAAEAARATAAEGVLQGNIDYEKSRIDAILIGASASADNFAEIVALINSVDTENDQAFAGYVLSNDAALAAEAARAIAAEGVLTSDLSAEAARAIAAEGVLTSDLSTEAARATAAEATLTAALDAEEVSRIAGDESLQASLNNEIADRIAAGQSAQAALDNEAARAIAAETTLQSALDVETAARISAVSTEEAARIVGDAALSATFSAAMVAEVSRATAAEGVLQGNIDYEKSRIDAILIGASASADNFAEIVALINSVDTENDQAFAGYVLSNDAALAAEVLRATAKEDLLFAALDGEINGRVAGDAALAATFSAALSTEEARATAAELVLTNNLSTEEAARIAADVALSATFSAALSAETFRATAAELQLSNDLSDESSYRIDADTLLQSNIDYEKSRIDAILIGASASADNFAEIVALINSVDTTNDEVFAGYVLSNDAALAAEVLRAQNSEAALSATFSAAISAEVAARIADVDAEETRALAAEAALQSDLANLQSYVDTTVDSAIATLTSDLDAETAARIADVDAEEARALAAEAALQSDLDAYKLSNDAALAEEHAHHTAAEAALSATFSAAMVAEVSRATAAEGVLQGNIDYEKSRIDAILIGASASADNFAEIVALINSVDTTNDEVFAGYVLSNDAALAAEVLRAQNSEAALSATFSAALSAEEVARIAGDAQLSSDLADLQSYVDTTVDSAIATLTSDLANETEARIADVDAEEARALAAEGVLQTNINTEANERVAEDITLQGNIDIEATRAQAAETAIATDLGTETAARISAISTEETARIAGDAQLTSDLATEAARATAAEGVLQGNIDYEKSRIDAILIGASASADNFAEIVALINSVDTTNDTAFASYVLSNDAALAAEAARATAAEAVLTSDLSTETARALAAEVVLTSDLASEAARATAAEATLTAALSAEEVSRIAGDESLQASLNNEIADRIAAGQSAQAALDNETTRAIAAEGVLTSDLSTEVSRALAAELVLTTDLSTEVAARIAGDVALSATFSAAIAAEVSRATAAELVLTNDFANIYSKKVAVTGTPNGVLTTFTLALPVRIGSEMIYVNGLLMEEGEDYTTIVTSGKVSGVEFLYAPISEMKVKAYGVCGVSGLINNA